MLWNKQNWPHVSLLHTPGLGILAQGFDRPNPSVSEVNKRLTYFSQEQVYKHDLMLEYEKLISNDI